MHPELNSQLAKDRVADMRRSAPARTASVPRHRALPLMLGRLRTIRTH